MPSPRAMDPPRPRPFLMVPSSSALSLIWSYSSSPISRSAALLSACRADKFPRVLPSGGRTSSSRSPSSLASIERYWSFGHVPSDSLPWVTGGLPLSPLREGLQVSGLDDVLEEDHVLRRRLLDFLCLSEMSRDWVDTEMRLSGIHSLASFLMRLIPFMACRGSGVRVSLAPFIKTLSQTGFERLKGRFLAPFCASCPTWVVPCLPISAHDSAHKEFSAHMPQQKWFARLRGQIKDRCGLGWGISDRNGDTQLTRRINDGKQHQNPRAIGAAGVPWNPACSGDIF